MEKRELKMCFALASSLQAELESINQNKDYTTEAQIEYAAHVTMMLFSNKVENYLKTCAKPSFRSRFQI